MRAQVLDLEEGTPVEVRLDGAWLRGIVLDGERSLVLVDGAEWTVPAHDLRLARRAA